MLQVALDYDYVLQGWPYDQNIHLPQFPQQCQRFDCHRRQPGARPLNQGLCFTPTKTAAQTSPDWFSAASVQLHPVAPASPSAGALSRFPRKLGGTSSQRATQSRSEKRLQSARRATMPRSPCPRARPLTQRCSATVERASAAPRCAADRPPLGPVDQSRQASRGRTGLVLQNQPHQAYPQPADWTARRRRSPRA